MKAYKSETHKRVVETILEIAIKITVIYVSYEIFIKLGEYFLGANDINNLAYSLLILPILYTLKNASKVIEPYTVTIEADNQKVTVTRGFNLKVEDTLEYKHIDNYELRTTFSGRFFNYGDVYLYSAGGLVEVPYIKDPKAFIETLNSNRTP
jgi:hypothetical protein